MSHLNNDPYRHAPNGNGNGNHNHNGNGNGHGTGYAIGNGNANGAQYPSMPPIPSQISGPPQTHYYQSAQTSGPHGNAYSSGPPTSGPSDSMHSAELAPLAPGVQPASDAPEGRSMVLDGWKYELFVVQQPKRARMCGFGDKDRRPITPPPCVKLVITDVATGKEVDFNAVDHGMFVVNTDLWHENGKDEVNMVRHSTTSPSISSTTPVSYQEIGMTPAYSSILPHTGGFKSEPGQGAPPSSYNPYPGPPQVNAYAGPQGGSQSYYPNNYPPATNGAAYPSQNGYSQPPGPSSYYPASAGHGPLDYPQGQQVPSNPYGPGGPRPYTPNEMPVARGPTNNSAPQGMFTRNLIGSLAASAFRLTDPDDRIGIWFILQDMSIRTEGRFRLRFSFVNVGVPVSPGNPGGASTLTTNKNVVPVLASCYSDVFNVYSAKRFPGVVESTALSKCFATQGIKIPIRKDGSGRGDRGGDNEEESTRD